MTMPVQKPGRSKQDYATPRDFLTAVKIKRGITAFRFDFAAGALNTAALQYWCEADNALSYPADQWAAQLDPGWSWGWLNPPFAQIAPWAERCAQVRARNRSLAFLVPAAVGANWFRDHAHQQARVWFLNGRLAFDPTNPTWGYPKDCVLCLYAPWVAPGYEVWNWRETLTSVEGLVARYALAQAEHAPAAEFARIGTDLRRLSGDDQHRYYAEIQHGRE